jgi:ribosomal protein S18 acetylase RimI-like enzyme
MLEVSLRRAGIDDAEALAQLSFKTFWDTFADHPKNAPDDLDAYMREAFSTEQIVSELADPKSIFVVAEINGELAGYSKLLLDHIEPGVTAEKPVELCRLYSEQKYIGKGVGKALMERCFDDARERDCDAIWLGVWEYNPRAQAFYAKHGFRIVGSHVFQLGSDPQTDMLMQKDL